MVIAAPKTNRAFIRSSEKTRTHDARHLPSLANDDSLAKGDRLWHGHSDGTASTDSQDNGWSEAFESVLVQAALDSLFDGILVINVKGDILQANHKAKRLLNYDIPHTLAPKNTNELWHASASQAKALRPFQPLLDEIWRVCSAVLDSREAFPTLEVGLDAEVAIYEKTFRIRGRWMELTIENLPCLLVTIEDLHQTALNQVNVDRWKYKLTPRETEVWGLKRQGYSYRAIAKTLYVTENTVKKHLKNIQSKRRAGDCFDD